MPAAPTAMVTSTQTNSRDKLIYSKSSYSVVSTCERMSERSVGGGCRDVSVVCLVPVMIAAANGQQQLPVAGTESSIQVWGYAPFAVLLGQQLGLLM